MRKVSTRNIIAAVFVMLVASSNAKAQSLEIPLYDVDASCDVVARRNLQADRDSGGVIQDPIAMLSYLKKSCVKAEQGSYNFIKAAWPDASSQTKRICLGFLSEYEIYNYSLLGECLAKYLPNDEIQAQGKFKY